MSDGENDFIDIEEDEEDGENKVSELYNNKYFNLF